MDISSHTRSPDEQVTVRDLVWIAWSRRWLIALTTLACAVIACAFALILPKEYDASVLISPVTSEQESHLGGLSSLVSQFGGLASLAGISPAADAKRSESLAILQSAALTERFIAQNRLLPVLFSQRWDSQTGRWKVPTAKIPTLWKANRYFKKLRSVETDPKTELVTLTIKWTNAQQAADWANALVAMTNEYTRQQAIDEAERNIAYLKSQATQTDIVEARQAIFTLLQSQLNKAMLARGTEQYALKVIDPAQPPETPSSPRPILWTAIGFVGGGILSLLIAFALGPPAAAATRASAAKGPKGALPQSAPARQTP